MNDTELLVKDTDVNAEEVISVNMKRHLKKPEDVAAMKYKDYRAIVKRITNSN